jgi:eukaryotic-like serine/threonine-protein kinase
MNDDPLLGRIIDGRFMLQSVLGRGGMGIVYRAHQASLERSVALKVMSTREEDPAREAEFQRRFFLEASTAAKLKHPNTITVFDYGSADIDGERLYFIAMELLDGVTLSRVLQKGPLPPQRAVNIALQICRSLREAHAAGVVHRDLKPGNIMLVKQDADATDDVDGDFVKVLDFGLAKSRSHAAQQPVDSMTKAGTFMGSPRYVAPEQIEGQIVDARADIYSFGCLFYRMLTGRVPFDGEQAIDILMKHIHDPVPALNNGDVPQVLDDLVMRCLEKKQKNRPLSMDEVIQVLKQARGDFSGRMVRAPTTAPSVSMPVVPSPRDSNSIAVQPAVVDAKTDGGSVSRSTAPAASMVPKSPGPMVALSAGIGVGLLLTVLLVVWRLWSVAPPPEGAAFRAVIVVTSQPQNVDVFDASGRVPQLLGVTPLRIPWQDKNTAPPRSLLLQKPGHQSVRASVPATLGSESKPTELVVDAVLQPSK